MPFLIMLLCQKNRFFGQEKTATSKFKVLMAACISHKQRHQFTRDSICANDPETGIALFPINGQSFVTKIGMRICAAHCSAGFCTPS
jgi:hypothetical protein